MTRSRPPAGPSWRSRLAGLPLVRHWRRPRTPWTRADRITAVGLVLSAAAGTLVVVQIGQAGDSLDVGREGNAIAQSAEVLQPGLRLAAAAAYLTDDLEGTSESSDQPKQSETGLWGPKIDLTLVNERARAALVSRVVLDFELTRHLEPCIAMGGSLQISVNYDVPIPGPPAPANPFTAGHDTRLEVEPAKHDRFTVTTGPRTIGDGSFPMIILVRVTLVHDGGSQLAAGRFALVDTGGNAGFYPGTDGTWKLDPPSQLTDEDRACFRRNAEFVERVAQTPGITLSREFVTLRDILATF